MQTNNYISIRERKFLLAIAFAAFIFSIAGSTAYSTKATVERAEYFREQEENREQNKPSFSGPYCFPDKHPQLLLTITLLVGTTCVALYFTKRCLLSFIFTTASLAEFVYWFRDSREQLTYGISDFIKGVDRYFYNASNFDLAVLTFVLILFFWQISILLRMLIKTLQRKSELP